MRHLVALVGLSFFGATSAVGAPSQPPPRPAVERHTHRFTPLRNARAMGLRLQRRAERTMANPRNPSHHLRKAVQSAGYLAISALPLAVLAVAKQVGVPSTLIDGIAPIYAVIACVGFGWNTVAGMGHLADAVTTALNRRLERQIDKAIAAHDQGAANRIVLRKLLRKAQKSSHLVGIQALEAALGR